MLLSCCLNVHICSDQAPLQAPRVVESWWGEPCRGGLISAFLAAQPKGYIFRHRGEEFKEDYVVKSMCCVASLSTYNCGKYQGVHLFFCGI